MKLLSDLPVPPGCALVATGSLARRELAPHSDLDLLLLHPAGVEPDVEKLWYPLWDSGYRIDHAVRTPEECAGMMSADSTAALALLEMRHLAGDAALTARTRELVLREWRVEIHRNFDALVGTAIARWRRAGSVVTMTHPDLKNGRGGLRDLDLLRALALAQLCDVPPLQAERRLLLDVRALLHTHARRRRDVLDPEFATDIAADLGMTDRHELSAEVAAAARRIDAAVTTALAASRAALGSRARGRRRPLDVDVVASGAEITLSRRPDLSDPALLLRVAAASARTGLPVSPHTWQRLRDLPDLPAVYTAAAAEDFFELLAHPEVVNDLDHHGLWTRLVPEWEHIRGRMPRERTHIHTIDQHSLVTVANCAAVGVSVARPDLLFLAALFHDIGKGYGRPHSRSAPSSSPAWPPASASTCPTAPGCRPSSPNTPQSRVSPPAATPLPTTPATCFSTPSTTTATPSTCWRSSPRPTPAPPAPACGTPASSPACAPSSAAPAGPWCAPPRCAPTSTPRRS